MTLGLRCKPVLFTCLSAAAVLLSLVFHATAALAVIRLVLPLVVVVVVVLVVRIGGGFGGYGRCSVSVPRCWLMSRGCTIAAYVVISLSDSRRIFVQHHQVELKPRGLLGPKP